MPFTAFLSVGDKTDRFTSETYDGAAAVVRAFELENIGNREAAATIYDQADIGFAAPLYKWRGFYKVGPKDERHPMQVIVQRAIAAGRPVYISDWDTGETISLAPVTQLSAHRIAA
jgi:hypothetical protein